MDDRVQKVLSQWGITSRRRAEAMITAGRVSINGTVAQLGQRIDPTVDRIFVDGKVVSPENRPDRVCLLMNKPRGVVCTCDDPQGRTTVLDLLPDVLRQKQGIHPVGRLDVDSTGALLLTNDGDLTFHLTHPRHQIGKTYRVWVQGFPSDDMLAQWRRGIELDGRKTLPADVAIVRRHPHGSTLLNVILHEGRNRQIRRVAEQLGHPVVHLHRTAIGQICLQAAGLPVLPQGSIRLLTGAETCFLNSQLDLLSKGEPVTPEECNV
jgi:23S rRNA pseudouridine2605 synthase